jgi:hypothetical protein
MLTEGRKENQNRQQQHVDWRALLTCTLATDLDENVIRNFGLDEGLVDVKVCAIDEVWSGLKFMYRTKDR